MNEELSGCPPVSAESVHVRPCPPLYRGDSGQDDQTEVVIPERIAALLARVARSRADKTTIRAALHQSRQYGLQARHQTKENRT